MQPGGGLSVAQDIELILLRQWASYLTMPIFLCDHEGHLLFYNEAAEPLLGRRYDEAGEMPVSELANIFETKREDGSPLNAEDLPLGQALRDTRPAHDRIRMKGLDNVWRTIEITAFPIEGQGERHLGAVALFWEVDHTWK
jgi:PAS domain-containing protein